MSTLISFSDAAKAEILTYLSSETLPEGYLLRVGVRGGACSADYLIGLDKATEHDDTLNNADFAVLVDRRQLLYIAGLVVDFVPDGSSGGFSFQKNTI